MPGLRMICAPGLYELLPRCLVNLQDMDPSCGLQERRPATQGTSILAMAPNGRTMLSIDCSPHVISKCASLCLYRTSKFGVDSKSPTHSVLCVHAYMCMYTGLSMYGYTNIVTYVCTYIYIHIYRYIYICAYVMCIRMYRHSCISVCSYYYFHLQRAPLTTV